MTDISESEPIRRANCLPDRSPEPDQVMKALTHPVRRGILRILHQAGEARSAKELSLPLNKPISKISYHLRALKTTGIVVLTDEQPTRGSVERFYASAVEQNKSVLLVLESAAEEDEGS